MSVDQEKPSRGTRDWFKYTSQSDMIGLLVALTSPHSKVPVSNTRAHFRNGEIGSEVTERLFQGLIPLFPAFQIRLPNRNDFLKFT